MKVLGYRKRNSWCPACALLHPEKASVLDAFPAHVMGDKDGLYVGKLTLLKRDAHRASSHLHVLKTDKGYKCYEAWCGATCEEVIDYVGEKGRDICPKCRTKAKKFINNETGTLPAGGAS